MTFLPLPSFGNYSKLINAAIGLAIGFGAVYLAGIGFGTCVPDPASISGQSCTIFGFSESNLRELVMSGLTLLFVHQSPPNVPKP